MQVGRRQRRLREQAGLDVGQVAHRVAGRRHAFVHLEQLQLSPGDILRGQRAQHGPGGATTAHGQREQAALAHRGARLFGDEGRGALGHGGVVGKDLDLHRYSQSRGSFQPPGGATRSASGGPQLCGA